jgi:hypothetical protein
LFGSHILLYLVENKKYKWILLKKKRCVVGFYYENPTIGPTIIRLGIISDSTFLSDTTLMPRYAILGFPSPLIAGLNAGLFLLVAVLSNLKKIELCRVASRCTGLLIHYINGLSAVFRQWHTSSALQHSCVYDSSRPSVDTICFKIAKRQRYQIIIDISFSDSVKIVPGSDDQVFSIGEVGTSVGSDISIANGILSISYNGSRSFTT